MTNVHCQPADAIRLDRVRVEADGRAILGELSHTLPAGSRTVVIGPSGTGKTTWLRLLAGFTAPDSGSIAFGTRPAAIDGRVLLGPAQRNVGYLPQDLGLWSHLRAAAQLDIVLAAHRVARRERRNRVAMMLDRLGLAGHARQRTATLSGGEQRRLALGRALIARPRLLLLDEPFGGLDYPMRDAMLALIRDALDATDATLVGVSHLHEETVTLADDLVVLEAGRIVEAGPLADVRSRPASAFAQRFFRDAPIA